MSEKEDLVKECSELVERFKREGTVTVGKVELPPLAIRKSTIWFTWKPKDQTPYVLSRRAVQQNWIPPKGVHCLPPELAQHIPSEFKYWERENASQRLALRNELVQAIRRGDIKVKLGVEVVSPPHLTKPVTGKFVLQRHWWVKRPIIRAGPTYEHWDVRIDIDKPYLLQFVWDDDPSSVESTSGVYKRCTAKSWMTKEGEIAPGQPGNPTPDTPAYVKIIDKGKVTIFEIKDTYGKLEFHGESLKGLFIITRESPDTDLWSIERTELPEAK